jgi:hypothetical protein
VIKILTSLLLLNYARLLLSREIEFVIWKADKVV